MQVNNISIIGAGGHSRAVYSWLTQSDWFYEEVQFLDSIKRFKDETIFGQPLKKVEWGLVHSINSDVFIIALGSNSLRRQVYESLLNANRVIGGVVHKSVNLGVGSIIDRTTSIGPQSIIGSLVTIKENTIINSGTIIEHESMIGAHTHIAPGVKIAGRVKIGSNTFIGIGSVIKDNIIIGDNVVVGAGAVVIKDVPDNTTVVGVPARVIGK
ncbi:acetyltransferase [Viridibacillus arvi]|uniref:acetyltransferase n=1 Tax=Viridibacillus arvi TaxID=263475 RepID=UPI003D0620AD